MAIVASFVLLMWSGVVVYWMHTRHARRPVRRRIEPAREAEALPAEVLNELELLIRNRVPVVEHPLSLPESLEFHGRPAVGWRYRHDPAHVQAELAAERPAPHMNQRRTGLPKRDSRQPRPNAVSQTHPSVRDDIVEPVYPDTQSLQTAATPAMSASQDYVGVRAPRGSSDAVAGRGLLDRVLSSVQGTSR